MIFSIHISGVGSDVHFFIIKYVSWTVYALFSLDVYILQHPVCHVCGGRIIQKNMFSCARIVEHDMSPLDSILTSKGQSCVTEMCAEAVRHNLLLPFLHYWRMVGSADHSLLGVRD